MMLYFRKCDMVDLDVKWVRRINWGMREDVGEKLFVFFDGMFGFGL